MVGVECGAELAGNAGTGELRPVGSWSEVLGASKRDQTHGCESPCRRQHNQKPHQRQKLLGPPSAGAAVWSAEAGWAGLYGRVTPGNLTEQLAMTEVRAAPAGVRVRVTMTDARWPAAEGWVKMAQNVNGVEMYYVRDNITGAVDAFTFASAG